MSAQVALSLLEAIQAVDRPREIIEDEVFESTMPRKLGLSPVVQRQVQRYRDHVRQGTKLAAGELEELIALVMRRPDSGKLYFETGARLADVDARVRGGGWLPRRLRMLRAKRAIVKGLRKLWGQRLGGFVSGAFTFEVSASPLVQLDASGDACELVTGFCQRALRRAVDPGLVVAMRMCETRGERTCRWELQE